MGVEMLSLKKFEAPVKSTEASNRPGIPNPQPICFGEGGKAMSYFKS